jgi:hypothetical protein
MMRSSFARVVTGLALALFVAAHLALASAPAHAAAHRRSTGGSITLKAAPTQPVPYGAELDVTVTVTPAVAPTTLGYYVDLYPQFDGGAVIAHPFQGLVPVGYTYTDYTLKFFTWPYYSQAAPAGGSHTLTIIWVDNPQPPSAANGTVTANFTIGPINLPAFNCSVVNGNYGPFFGVGQSVPLGLDFGNVPLNTPVDWQDAKYDVTLTGPTTVTYTDLTPTATRGLAITVPQNGIYTYQCTFKGTPSFNLATSSVTSGLTISLNRALGAVQLFSNPTTVATGQAMDMEVVFHPASGGPMPSGYFHVDLIGGGAYYYTAIIAIPPGGDTLVHLSALPNLNGVTNVRVSYAGDTTYAPAGVLFPLTNPPIPGTGSGSGGGPAPTPTAAPSPTATTAPTSVAATGGTLFTPTPLGTTPRGVYAAGTPWYQHGGALWWVLLAALLVVLGGAGGGAFWWRRRGQRAALASPEAPDAEVVDLAHAAPPPADPAT